jgi:hypothetical protein
MVSRSETGSPHSTEVEVKVTCIGCRKAKVKCDMSVPCSRCTRLSVECVPTPPSQRGRNQTKRRRVVGVQTEEVSRNPLMKYNSVLINSAADGLEPTAAAGA